jgi:hypothetical protein
MAEDEFSQNLLRVIVAELHFLNGMTAAPRDVWQELFCAWH